MKRILVTGGAGFIGSNFVRYMLRQHPDLDILVLDALTYAGNLENLADVADNPRFFFFKGDIRDEPMVDNLVPNVDTIVNFAAETFVDRSIHEPGDFVTTDVVGTFRLLEAARKHGVERFVHISTDEVYGSVEQGSSVETDPVEPRSPYSASKAASDLLARSYFVTYGVPVIITRASNNYGPYQHPEKLIPFFITNALEDKPLPVYGDGQQVRDWLFVEDHCSAIDMVLQKGVTGEVYNVGGGYERTNLEVTRGILEALGKDESLIKYVKDRPGHDRRYSLDTTKLRSLGWTPKVSFDEGLPLTVRWYVENEGWWRRVREGESFQQFHRAWYKERS
ncbi:MAG: dTDP-glucose 4,6-dehydratase [Armatimonadota bacterium]|nr:MAG: dTDP-glucose 4,6-dehydratase [Armatimonadota bacterium]